MSQHKCPFKQGEEEPASKIKDKNLIRRQSKNLCFLKGAHKLFQFTGILLIKIMQYSGRKEAAADKTHC
jgi:hypothetical protein